MIRTQCRVWLLLSLCAVVACGGGDDGDGDGDGQTPTGPSNPGSGTSAATITIGPSGVSPSTATIARGSRVTFVNNDTEPHTMSSNPHPIHTDCPPLNIGTLGPGGSRESGILNTARTCGFHDHDDPTNPGLLGTITVQ